MTVGKSTITKRWVLNTLCVIIVVLLGLVAVAMMLFKEQYYESVRLTMNSRATGMVSSYFNLSSTICAPKILWKALTIRILWKFG